MTCLVIVEDPVSAIKIARISDSMPLLGSNLPVSKLNALKGLYSSLILWLDHDKGINAYKIAEKARLIGFNIRVILTKEDPKCYSTQEIKKLLDKHK